MMQTVADFSSRHQEGFLGFFRFFQNVQSVQALPSSKSGQDRRSPDKLCLQDLGHT